MKMQCCPTGPPVVLDLLIRGPGLDLAICGPLHAIERHQSPHLIVWGLWRGWRGLGRWVLHHLDPVHLTLVDDLLVVGVHDRLDPVVVNEVDHFVLRIVLGTNHLVLLILRMMIVIQLLMMAVFGMMIVIVVMMAIVMIVMMIVEIALVLEVFGM